LAEIACGNFSGHHPWPAVKKRDFCRLRFTSGLKVTWGDFSA